ncbi:AlpA family transcriptional regulator [Mesorhizobium sp. M7A.F.Ca.US.011.01.1.1]|uniref:helix-turn-helix transcriptional regulator n=1 Tax=Mesorhizobium sp. M7A.F.Ca.US.011.01.1.1 TaxID=2496741 RepID=UPI000FCA2A86|nr:AlpA family transcriptional regulator [Mesorhizobium sp. M7A.F.Ca.US.011.01.1.1]RUX28241.1 AlpA family transcriptional regulator [Mesorhizobium sp. M7A.F.Ca.US.011.01.1.1]
MTVRIVRLKELVFRSGLGRSSIYEMVSTGDFPAPVQIGERAIGWIESEFETWLNAKTAQRDAIRASAAQTHAQQLRGANPQKTGAPKNLLISSKKKG